MKTTLFIILLIISSCTHSNTRFTFGYGKGNVDISQDVEGTPLVLGDSLGVDLSIGYGFSNGIITDIGISYLTDDFLFGASDNASLKSFELSTGYQFTKNKFYIEPMVGLAFWDINASEGALFNSGPEASLSDTGTDIFFSLAIGYKISSHYGVSISYKQLNFDDAKATSYFINFDRAF